MEVNRGDDGPVVLPGHMHVGAKRADDREMCRNLIFGGVVRDRVRRSLDEARELLDAHVGNF